MTSALMSSRQVFLALTIIDDNTLLARPLVPITSLFFLALAVYQQWLNFCEITREILNLVDAVGMAAVPFLNIGVILAKSLAFGMGLRL